MALVHIFGVGDDFCCVLRFFLCRRVRCICVGDHVESVVVCGIFYERVREHIGKGEHC